MQTSQVLTLFDYNYWANKRVLEAAIRAGDMVFAAPGKLSHGGLRGTLVHILGAEWLWRMRCQEKISPQTVLTAADFPDLDSIRRRWNQEELAMCAYLEALQDRDLLHPIRHQDTRGKSFENALWQLLLHVINHGTQHRGEAAQSLTEHGYSPGDVDLVVYLREKG